MKFPVGAVFDDFRVEAQYADGYTCVVTKQATITTPQSPQELPGPSKRASCTAFGRARRNWPRNSRGSMPRKRLGVEVVAAVDADELRVDPAHRGAAPR